MGRFVGAPPLPVVAVGQNAYQAGVMTGYAAAWKAFAQTSNRYSGAGNTGGDGSLDFGSFNDSLAPAASMRSSGRSRGSLPLAGNALHVNGVGGAGYVSGDIVTFAPVNRGRPIKVRVAAVAGGVTSATLLDPGSGLVLIPGFNREDTSLANPATLAQASTSGIGAGASWSALPAANWGVGVGPMVSA